MLNHALEHQQLTAALAKMSYYVFPAHDQNKFGIIALENES
jgi:hypothetical protein